MLDSARRKQLYDNLLDTFRDYDTLEQALLLALDVRLPQIAAEGALTTVVFNLLDWAEANDRVDNLAKLLQPPHADSPYPGLVAFTDAAYFYGREAATRDLVNRLASERFLLVVGPSGAGKSSLIYAGLLPNLPPSPTWVPRVLRPTTVPLPALSDALGGDPRRAATLTDLLTARGPTARLLLVVDQLEEVFGSSVNSTDRTAFFQALQTLYADPRCSLILAMRADFYPDLMNTPPLWTLAKDRRVDVTALAGADLEAAIVEPARRQGVTVEPELVRRLVADMAGEPGALPLLQVTLNLLWNQLRGRVLTYAAYARMGSGGHSGLQVALALHADSTWAAVPEGQRAMARRIFLRLVQFGEGRPDTRRQQTESDLLAAGDDPALFAHTLRYLADKRLLTLGGDGQRRTVDIAHEALIAGWPLLSSWLLERREAEQTRRRLAEKAEDWVRMSRTGGLLDEVELREADRWLASSDAADLGYDTTLPDLVAASQHAIAVAKDQEEAVRRREIEQAAALARAQQQRAEEQAATNRRLRWGAGGLAVLLIAAITLGATAFRASQEASAARLDAERRLHQARAQALAALSGEQLVVDPQRSLLLALAAVSTTQVLREPVEPAAATALHTVLLQAPQRLHILAQPPVVLSVAWSPDGRWIASTGDRGTVTIWDAVSGQQVRTLVGHQGLVNSIAWSRDGQRLLTAGDDGTARIWEATDGRELRPLPILGGKVFAAAWKPDGRAVVTAVENGTAQIWDVGTGVLRTSLQVSTDALRGVDWSPDGKTIVTAGDDGLARIWDVAATPPTLRATLCGHTAGLFSARYSPDGHTIVTSSADYTARLWKTLLRAPTDCSAASLVLVGHQGQVDDAVYRPDGQALITVSQDGTAKLWDASTGQIQATLTGFEHTVTAAAWSPNGQQLTTGTADGLATIWNVTPGQERPTLHAGLDGAWTAHYSPDGTLVALAGYTQTATLWNADSGQQLATLTGHTDRVWTAFFSPDGKSILTASEDGTARLWEAPSGHIVRVLQGHKQGVHAAVFSPDGTRIATAGKDGTARLWDTATGAAGPVLQGDSSMLTWVVWSPDGRTLASTSESGTAWLWDTATGGLRATLRGHTKEVFGACFRPDSRRIATMSHDGTAKLWDVATGRELATLVGHTGPLYSIAYSPHGETILTAGVDGTARLWNAETGDRLRTLAGHTAAIFRAIYSPDGAYIVTVSQDKTVKIWNPNLDQAPVTLSGAADLVDNVDVRPDGSGIIVPSRDGNARQYVIPIDALLQLAQQRVTRRFTPEEQVTYQIH